MTIQNGDTVTVQYVGLLDDGNEFDRSTPDRPFIFQVGEGQVIPGFENAVLGKAKGDTFSVTIPPEEAYGLHDEQLVFTVPSEELPPNLQQIKAGDALHVPTDQGELEVLVAAVDEKQIVLDANHPLAGKSLTFQLEIIDVG